MERVVVVGAGFAGLGVVRELADSGAEVTLVDRNIYSTFQPLLYQVATGGLNPGDVAYLVRGSVRKRHARFRHGSLATIDHEAREAVLDSGVRLPFDHLVLATGVTTNYFGIPGAAEHAHAMYRRDEAITVRDLLMGELEALADRQGDAHELSIVVVGGGPTGVEMAGTLAELRNVALGAVFPEIDRQRFAVHLVEQAPELLGQFHPKLRAYTRRQLERRRVSLKLGSAITEVGPTSVTLADGTTVRADLTIWATGVTAPAAVGGWGVPQGKGGRIVVDRDFRVAGHDRIFAAGDIAAFERDALPQLAQPAIQGGRYVGRVVKAELARAGPPAKPFRYRNKGTMATIGRASAIAELPLGIRLTGLLAWLTWVAVHIESLLGGRNRVSALINLTWRYLAWPSGSGIIVGDTLHPAPASELPPESGPPPDD